MRDRRHRPAAPKEDSAVQNLRTFSPAADSEQLINMIGDERLTGSGFENEDPDLAFAETED